MEEGAGPRSSLLTPFLRCASGLAAPEPAFRLAYVDIGKTASFLMVNAYLNKLFLFQNGILLMKKK